MWLYCALFMWYYVRLCEYILEYIVWYIRCIIIVILCGIWACNVWCIMYVYCKLYVMYYVIYIYIMYIMMYIIVGLWCSCLMVLCRCIVLCWYNFILYLGMWSCLLLCVQMVLFRPDFCVIKVCYNFCVTFVYYFVVVCYPIFTAVFDDKVECISLFCYIFATQVVI